MPPFPSQTTRLENREKAVGVEQLIPNTPIERLNVGILRWLAGFDEVELNIAFRSPTKHRVARKLAAVVKANRPRKAAVKGQVFEGGDDVVTSKRETDLKCQTFSREVIDDIERSDRSA